MALNAAPDARDDPRDAQLAAWYREGGGPEPSPALDQAILAAAHREAGARPRVAGFPLRRWRVPLSLAAVVVLSVTVVTLVREDRGDLAGVGAPSLAPPAARAPAATEAERPPVQEGTPGKSPAQQRATPEAPDARASKGASTSPPAPLGQVTQPPSPLKDEARLSPGTVRVPAEPFPGAAPPPDAAGSVPAAAPQSEPAAAAAERGEREDARRAAGPRDDAARAGAPPRQTEAQEQAVVPGAVPPAAKSAAAPPATVRREGVSAESRSLARLQAQRAPAPSGSDISQLLKELDKEPPERWLEKFEELRRAGRQVESDELLAAFRKRFPDHPAPSGR